MIPSLSSSFFLMLLSASSLPLLAFLALILRRDTFQGKAKTILLGIGVALLSFAVISSIREHGGALTWKDGLAATATSLLTLFILSRFSHGHSHTAEKEGAKGIVISEAFHSLLDGAVIGTTYLINPILGYAATLGIIIHELPKIIGTLALFRSLGLSVRKTIIYGIVAQIGSPVAAMFVYTFGKQINGTQLQSLEIASIASLASIVLWIIFLEIQFHVRHPHTDKEDKHPHKH